MTVSSLATKCTYLETHDNKKHDDPTVQLTAMCKNAGVLCFSHILTELNKFVKSPEITIVPKSIETSGGVTHSSHTSAKNDSRIKIMSTIIAIPKFTPSGHCCT